MRYLISLAVSCVVVFFLFLGMNKLITPDHRELVEKEDVSMTDFIRIKPQETLQERQRELPKPPPPNRPLPLPRWKWPARIGRRWRARRWTCPNSTSRSTSVAATPSVPTAPAAEVAAWAATTAPFRWRPSSP